MFLQGDDPDKPLGGTADAARLPGLPPEEEIGEALNELTRLRDDREAYEANWRFWVIRWTKARYQVPQQLLQLQQQRQQQEQKQQEQKQQEQKQQEQKQQQLKNQLEPATRQTSDTFSIEFNDDFTEEEVQKIAAALADYFRACGGAGFEYQFNIQVVATEKS